mgnify:CR=1 FL=1
MLVSRSRRLESVANARSDTTIRYADKTEGACFANTVLINTFFREIHNFKTNIQLIIDIIVDACIQLATVQCVDWEAECAAAACVSAASKVIGTEAFTPGVTHSG